MLKTVKGLCCGINILTKPNNNSTIISCGNVLPSRNSTKAFVQFAESSRRLPVTERDILCCKEAASKIQHSSIDLK